MKPTEDHLPPYRVRPRFEIRTPYSVEELVRKIKAGLQNEPTLCQGQVSSIYATIYLPEEEQHYWSPQLSLTFEDIEDGSLLRGLYGPRPGVWTMFVFFYSLLGFAILIISIFGFSNYSLGNSSKILYLIPVLILIFCSLYFVAWSGQNMGRKQMQILHSFVEKNIEMNIT